ncbi:MAG: hypothetical protein JSW59_12110 [Phycisphaerales bacterium]|nr:MAG: hypothetical protein JSW59_12110 [Phycisphaerales bacterium]
MKKLLRSKRKGAAVPLAVVAMMLLLAMGASLLTLGRNARIYAARTSSVISARAATDAGLTMALFEMNEQLQTKSLDDKSLPEADKLLPYADSAFSHTVTLDPNGTYGIESTGTAGGIEKVVGCTLQVHGLFDYAVFADDSMKLRDSCKVDWYHYDKDDKPLQIGTNSIAKGAITLKSSAYVNGDAVVGVGGDPDVAVSNDGKIEGDILVSAQEHDLPAIAVPQWLQSLPSSGEIKYDTILFKSAKYSSIYLQNSKKIIVVGDVDLYVTGDVVLDNSAEVVIKDNASLTLYVSGDLKGKNSSNFKNLSKNTRKLQIYGLDSCKAMDFENGSEMYGTVYAPNATVVMHSSNKVYGAVVARTIDWINSGELYYDASLRDVSVNDGGMRFVVKNWHEK